MIYFEVPGIIVGKQRPHFARRGNKIITYTPNKTENAEEKIALFAKSAGVIISDRPIALLIELIFPIPKSFSKFNYSRAIQKSIMPTKRPDIDNCLKTILDALNGIAYKDDAQVVKLGIFKFYGEISKTKIWIKNI